MRGDGVGQDEAWARLISSWGGDATEKKWTADGLRRIHTGTAGERKMTIVDHPMVRTGEMDGCDCALIRMLGM